jgi:tetratricopeptide (TPR) repeat protein
MENKTVIKIFVFIAIITSVMYFVFQYKWVIYRKAENAYLKKEYCLARSLYLASLNKNLNPKYINKKIIDLSNILDEYLSVDNTYLKLIKKNKNEELIIDFANFYIGTNRDDKAMLLYEKFINEKSKNLKIKIANSKLLSRQGEYKKAAIFLEDVLQKLKKSTRDLNIDDIKLNLAREYGYEKEFKKADNLYKEIIRKNKKTAIELELVNVYLKDKKYLDALNLLKKISFSNIDDTTKLMLVNLYLYFDQDTNAKRIYKKFLKEINMHSSKIDEKVNFYISNNHDKKTLSKSFIEAYSSNDEVLINLGKRYVDNRMEAEAIKVYEYLDKRDKKLNIKLLLELASSYKYLKKYDKAINVYEILEQVKPSYEVKKELGLLKSINNEDKKALELLLNLQAYDNRDVIVLLEIARIYVRENQIQKANDLFEKLLKEYPCNINVKNEYAFFQALLGHVKVSKALFLELLNKTDFRRDIFFRFANSLKISGDFYKAEDIYLYLLSNEDSDQQIKYAYLLASMQRYEEANGILEKLIFEKKQVDASFRMLSEIAYLQKDIKKALYYSKKAYFENSDNIENNLIYFKFLAINNKLNLAISFYPKLEKIKKYKAICLYYMAKYFENQNQIDLAKDYLAKALKIDNSLIEAQFNLLKLENKLDEYQNIIEKTNNTIILEKYGNLFSNLNLFDIANKFYEKALLIDPNCFFAKLSLSISLSSNHEYLKALEILDEMQNKYFSNYKILITKARVLSWSKNYDQSIYEYNKLLSYKENDPEIIKEKAIVYSWAKETYKAQDVYRKALCPMVSEILLDEIIKSKKIENEKLISDLIALKNCNFLSYEIIKENIDSYNLNEIEKHELEKILVNLLSKHEIQKSIFLEKEAKEAFYNEKYLKSANSFEKLVKFHPYNQEALFDLAQCYCVMNLCNKSLKTYKKLLKFDSSHNLAKIAYQRNLIDKHPFIDLKYKYFNEEGRGDLDRIIQNRLDFLFGFPIRCNHKIKAAISGYIDEPTYEKKSQIKDSNELKNIKYKSIGYNFYYQGRISAFINVDSFFSQKFYLSDFRKTTEGGADLNFNLNDYAFLNLSFNKENKLDNIFSLRQRIQNSEWKALLTSSIKKRLDLQGALRYYNISDNNHIAFHDIQLSYRFTQHPNVLKFTYIGEYRNSENLNRYIYEGSELVNIIHPYWTPNNYSAYRLMLSFFHDFSNPLICSNQKREYMLKLFYGDDTEKNPTVRFEADFNISFFERYKFIFTGYIHQSKLWDAVGVNALFKYQF